MRTLETTGLILSQALTDSDLFVQTAQDYVPAGSGTLAVAPLDEPEAEPSTLRTDQWLVGAPPMPFSWRLMASPATARRAPAPRSPRCPRAARLWRLFRMSTES